MNSGDGKFTTTSFDVQIEHSLTLNYHSTPPSTLRRVTYDALQTLGIPDRCFGLHRQAGPSTSTSPRGSTSTSPRGSGPEPFTSTSPTGRSLVHIPDYLLLTHSARSYAPPTPQGSSFGSPFEHPRAPAPFGAGDPFERPPSPPQGPPRARHGSRLPPDCSEGAGMAIFESMILR